MTAQVVRGKLELETIIDDIGEIMNDEIKKTEETVAVSTVSLDEDKLAKLRAKLAAKTKETEMIANRASIAKKDKSINFGVVGSGQAGCIDGSTNIYLSEYGIIPIGKFFNSKLNSSNLEDIEVKGSKQICIHLKEPIYTVSIDPETGIINKALVKAIWKNRVCSRNKISTSNNTELICSKIHPSLVFRPNSRRRAFFSSLNDSKPLSIGDNLVDTRLSVLDQISQITYIRNIEITEDFAWLLGLFAGDGHDSLNVNEISFYLDDSALIDKAISVCKKLPHTSIKVNDKIGCKQVVVYGLAFKLFIESAFEFNSKSYGGIGNKTYTISIPKCISAGSSSIRAAFLSGMIDSDGTISNNWCETAIFTTSKLMANQLGCLISSIGGRASVEDCITKRDNEVNGWRIKIYGKINHGPLISNIIDNLSNSKKKNRLQFFSQKDQKSFTNSVVPLQFSEIKHWLKKAGMKTVNFTSVKSKTDAKAWSRGERRLSLQYFDKFLGVLEDDDQIKYVRDIAPKLLSISSIETLEESEDFYDLTVEKYENYVAGNNGFIFTHNSRLAQTFYSLGYDSVVINTASQDLKFIDIPESNKLLLEHGFGGAAKELEIGKQAAENYKVQIEELISTQLADAQVFILTLSLGGGSGAGSCETLINILSTMGKPIVVMTILPMDSEDAKTKSNALHTLSKLSKYAQEKKISNLIVVDNAQIEAIYHNVGQMEFFNIANKAIVEPIDTFNILSSMPSTVKPLDSMEFLKLFVDGEGLSVYGSIKVKNYQEEDAIAEAVIENLNGNLLAAGFDLKESKYVGVIVAANAKVWKDIPAANINYALALIDDQCGHPNGVFKGMYTTDSQEDCLTIYSFFSGLGLPSSRVSQLTKESAELAAHVKSKDDKRNLSLNLDTGKDNAVSKVQELKNKIAQKSSAFGKLVNNNVIDRRK